MDEFSYLSVLLSVVIGLAVAEILQGFRQRLLAHGRVSYWPGRLWAATLLLVCAQTWWAMFGLRARHGWRFEEFLILLTQTILLYLIAGIVFPDFSENETIDLREYYFRQRKRFFALLIAAAIVSIPRDVVLNHALPDRTNLTFHGIFIVTSIGAILTANEWYHKLRHHPVRAAAVARYLVHWSTQSLTVLYQRREFCGFKTQWPSSGK